MALLAVVIAQMEETLVSLQQVMDTEHRLLSAEEINGSLLQRATEEKSSLLATLNYLEQQRRACVATEQNPQVMQRWQQLISPLQQLRDLNEHNGWLLEHQIERTSQVLQLLKPYQENPLYGADGHTTLSKQGNKTLSV